MKHPLRPKVTQRSYPEEHRVIVACDVLRRHTHIPPSAGPDTIAERALAAGATGQVILSGGEYTRVSQGGFLSLVEVMEERQHDRRP